MDHGETERQMAMERGVLLALRNGMALVRRDLEVHGLRINGVAEFVSKSRDYGDVWQDALDALEKRFTKK